MSENKNMVKLNGNMIKREDDKVSLRSQYFDFLDVDLDRYKEVEYTKEEAQYIKSRMQHLSTGAAAALPLICKGPQCPFAAKCPFIAIDKQRTQEYSNSIKEGLGQFAEKPKMETPVGCSCLVEVNLMNEWTRVYIYEFDAINFVDIGMCRELAEIEVMLWRINNGLSKEENASLEEEVNMGADRQGNPLTRKETHHFVDAKDRLLTRKEKKIKLLVGDRQEKYKKEAALKMREEKDPSSSAAKLRNQLQMIIKKAEAKALELAEAEGNVIDVPYQQDNENEAITPESLIEEEGREG